MLWRVTKLRFPASLRAVRRLYLGGSLRQKDFYVVLGVEKTASKQQIRDAYLDHVKEKHPDVREERSEAEREKIDEEFLLIQEAYSVLSDDDERRRYDELQLLRRDVTHRSTDDTRSYHFKMKPAKSEGKFGMRRDRYSEHFVTRDYTVGQHPSWKSDFDSTTGYKLKMADILVYFSIFAVLALVSLKIARNQQDDEDES